MNITDEELAQICIDKSDNVSDHTEVDQNRKLSLQYYFGQPRGDEVDGNSQVQSLDVQYTVNAILSQVMPHLTSSDLVQFEAVSEQDEQQARIESTFVNYVVSQKNPGFINLETAMKDVLLSKNCTSRVDVEITEDVEKERYKELTPEEMMFLLQPNKPNQVIDVTKLDEETGTLNLKRITTTRKLCITNVPPENFIVEDAHRSPYLEDCNYCCETYWATRQDMIEQGYDPEIINNLPHTNADTDVDALARDDGQVVDFDSNVHSMQMLEIKCHHINIARDGDTASLWKVLTCEQNYIDSEEAECIPYANGIGWLNGHRYYGISAFDLVKEVQDGKTAALRQLEDNARAGNHVKEDVVEDQVAFEDFLDGRHNAIRRVENINATKQIPHVDVTGACVAVMEVWNSVRTEASGSSLDIQANSINMPTNVGDQGVNTVLANLEQVSGLITKNFTETYIKSLYKIVHKYLRLYFPEMLNAKMTGQWQQTNPSEWLERDDLSVLLPPSRSEKAVQQVGLEKMMASAMMDMQQGNEGITVSQADLYQMRLDHARLSGIDNPEKYLINPESPEAQQAMQNRAMTQQQMQQMQMQQEETRFQQTLDVQRSEIQRNAIADEKDRQFQYTELEMKTALDKYEADLKAETDEAKIIGDATTKLEVESMKVSKPETMTNDD